LFDSKIDRIFQLGLVHQVKKKWTKPSAVITHSETNENAEQMIVNQAKITSLDLPNNIFGC
jgi:hypothetical protein